MHLKTLIIIQEPNSSNLNILSNHMLIPYRMQLLTGAIIFAIGMTGCSDKPTQSEEKKDIYCLIPC